MKDGQASQKKLALADPMPRRASHRKSWKMQAATKWEKVMSNEGRASKPETKLALADPTPRRASHEKADGCTRQPSEWKIVSDARWASKPEKIGVSWPYTQAGKPKKKLTNASSNKDTHRTGGQKPHTRPMGRAGPRAQAGRPRRELTDARGINKKKKRTH